MKEFTTALKQNDTLGDVAVEFKIDGYTLRMLPPTAAQMAVAIAGVGRHVDVQTKLATIIDFFYETMDADSAAYVRQRLLDRGDQFGLEEVEKILHWALEEWTGRPTQESQDSSPSQQPTGPSSTPPTSESTSSPSHRADSSTSSIPG